MARVKQNVIKKLWLPKKFHERNDDKALKEMSLRFRIESEANRWKQNAVEYDYDTAVELWNNNKQQFSKLIEDIIILGESSVDGMKDAVVNIRNGMGMSGYEFDEQTFTRSLIKIIKITTIYKMMKLAGMPGWAIRESISQTIRKEYGPDEKAH